MFKSSVLRRNTRKTVAVSTAMPEYLASSSLKRRRASAPFALLSIALAGFLVLASPKPAEAQYAYAAPAYPAYPYPAVPYAAPYACGPYANAYCYPGMRMVTDTQVPVLDLGLDTTDIRGMDIAVVMDIVAGMGMDTVAATMADIVADMRVVIEAVMPGTRVAGL